MKKILITGITGLLGSYLAKSLSGKALISGTRRAGSNTDLLGSLAESIQWYEGEITDVEMLTEACQDQDLVIHSAGLVSFDDSKKEALLKTNAQGTACLVNAMLPLKQKKLVFISSVAALGRQENQLSLTEEQKWLNSELNTPYGISKHLAELEVWRGAQEGLQVMVFNPSVLLAKITDERSSSQIYRYVLDGNRYYPKGNINYIDIRDAVAVMLQLIEEGEWNQRYIISKESLPYRDFFNEMALVFGKKPPSIALSNWLAAWVIRWSRLHNWFSKSKLPISRQTVRAAQTRVGYDNSKIKEATGYAFTPLKDTFEWAMANEKEKGESKRT
ncbi:NAD-dependent epimerase/dehydratase family protein [Cyclobacterium jeungdonense]|uniref:NAD-dependent epimerase/dehydratase family protein n=1 Tax=Cyclobacterium jeungdonense TaxID=708087 RepID=A0ABT8C6J7_9BACT|nr:NAD-dependent epimerase/dehydratase family protein [Cyclobacterium jeungdonense]MDN3687727.1 NAD-dependent epimerase/dehydratase family protein [Cyclobacterium jeungdonense]